MNDEFDILSETTDQEVTSAFGAPSEEIMEGATPLEDTLTDAEIDQLYCDIDAVCDKLGYDDENRDEARMLLLGLVERWVPTDCDHCGEPFQPLQERCHKSCAC